MTTVVHKLPRLESIQFQQDSMMCGFQFMEKRPLKGFTGLIDWRLLGGISNLQISNRFVGQKNDSLLVLPGNRLPANYFVLIGAGEETRVSKDSFSELLDTMFDCARRLKTRHIIVSLPGRDQNHVSGEEAIPWFFEYCTELLSTSLEFSCVIIDTSEMQSLIAAEAERHRMRSVLPVFEPGN